MELGDFNKIITSYLVYAAPFSFVLNYTIFAIKKHLSKPLLFCVILFACLSILGLAFLKMPINIIFVYFFFIPYNFLCLDGFSIIYGKDWTKALKILSIIQVLLVISVMIAFNLFRAYGHPPLAFLAERIMILILGILFFFSCKYQQKQQLLKSTIFKILVGINILACWIYFSKVTFSKESFIFSFSF